jgi:hypothetical protein
MADNSLALGFLFGLKRLKSFWRSVNGQRFFKGFAQKVRPERLKVAAAVPAAVSFQPRILFSSAAGTAAATLKATEPSVILGL